MGKRGNSNQKKEKKNAKKSSRYEQHAFSSDEMDDEIDAFHKQRDIIPLDINDDAGESDDDDEVPVFNFKDIDNEDDENEEGEDEDDDYDDEDANDNVAKMIRQRKYLRAKFGEGEDELHDDDDEDEEDNKLSLGGKKFAHGAENRNFELQSSDDEAPKEEEELALQMQREKSKYLTMEDYDLVDISEDKSNEKLTLKEASEEEKRIQKPPDRDITFKVEDLNAMSKEEQMNVLYRSAPELVGWLAELNEAHKQLECTINPFLSKVKRGEIVMEGGVRYFELKQLLLLSYCQAITFYLLLKSEGQSVHNHPVIARLEEIKKLLDQIKQLDAKLPVELEDILEGNQGLETVLKSDSENASMTTDSFTRIQEQSFVSAKLPEKAAPHGVIEVQNLESSKDNVKKARKDKNQDDDIGVLSLEMLKVRASLEKKLKQKGLYGSITPKRNGALKRLRPVNGQLETYDDFDDDAVDVKGAAGLVNGLGSNSVSKLLSANLKKTKVVSGDDDLPKRDDIGERRRKHELRVLAGAGIKTEDSVDDDMDDLGSDEVADKEDDVEGGDSGNEFYEQVEQQRAAKLAAKAKAYSWNPADPSLPEETVDGKRHISSQMEKNRGLTRNRKRLTKNPRKKYKLKHQKAVKNRMGQVRSIKKPSAPYGGETSGINAAISRSTRFKS